MDCQFKSTTKIFPSPCTFIFFFEVIHIQHKNIIVKLSSSFLRNIITENFLKVWSNPLEQFRMNLWITFWLDSLYYSYIHTSTWNFASMNQFFNNTTMLNLSNHSIFMITQFHLHHYYYICHRCNFFSTSVTRPVACIWVVLYLQASETKNWFVYIMNIICNVFWCLFCTTIIYRKVLYTL